MKKIIINADDFGYSSIFNEEILKLAKNKKITGISVMSNFLKSTSKEQVEEILNYKDNLGLHVDFENIDLEVTDFYQEIKRQWDEFVKYLGTEPVFLDMHKYKYREEGQAVIEKFAADKKVFYRNLTGERKVLTTSCKKITGSFLQIEDIIEKIESLPENCSTTILFHPGRFDKDSKSSFNKERVVDIKNIILLNKYIDENNDCEAIGYKDL